MLNHATSIQTVTTTQTKVGAKFSRDPIQILIVKNNNLKTSRHKLKMDICIQNLIARSMVVYQEKKK